ncbi:sugar transferase [Streptomyces sp. DSM 44917]|uniref:Sugar transferase n=1 Tax=Streptomyces boetiae TaxID=3075541 RepID=A0ABU2L3U3_9ACTN|nr:sugar transferase [Streptomyces sp. DSM 44917]MDT0306228.1 sugar transferase [Streptomyces sp. DSM 44917]
MTADALGVLLPVLTVYALDFQPRPAAAAGVATAAWLAVRAGHRRYAAGRLGESRGLLAAAHDWLLLLGLLAGLRAVTGEGSSVSAALLALTPALLITAATSTGIHAHLTRRRHLAHALRRVLVVGEAGPVDLAVTQLAARTDHPYLVIGAVLAGHEAPTCGVPELGRLAADAAPALSGTAAATAVPPSAPSGPAEAGEDAGPGYLIPEGTDGPAVLAAAHRHDADLVLVLPGARLTGDRLRRLNWAVQDAGYDLALASGLTEVGPHRLSVSTAAGLNLLHVDPPLRHGLQPALKAALDRAAAALALLLLAVPLLVLAAAIRLDSAGPVLFRQTRVGHLGRPFTLWKFRTMVPDAELRRPELEAANDHTSGPLFKMRRDPRVTRLGRVLRRTSLDELPQLWNVLCGQMALVGPRPPLPEEVAAYGAVELRRLGVKPGMTGLWQVSGRSDLSWDEGLALDLSYADNWSLTTDLDVLTRTLRAVADGRGAY